MGRNFERQVGNVAHYDDGSTEPIVATDDCLDWAWERAQILNEVIGVLPDGEVISFNWGNDRWMECFAIFEPGVT